MQFPIARAHADLVAADLVVKKACALFEAERDCGAEANMGKMLAADAAWKAADACLQTFGGFGFAREYGIERKWREPALSDRADLDQSDPRLHRPARTGPAAVILALARRPATATASAHRRGGRRGMVNGAGRHARKARWLFSSCSQRAARIRARAAQRTPTNRWARSHNLWDQPGPSPRQAPRLTER